jgi:hypothetical protein
VARSEFPRTRLDDAGKPHLPPRDPPSRCALRRAGAGYAIEPTAHISRRPHAHDAVAGPGVRRVARMVQENSLQAAGPPRGAALPGRQESGWRSIGRSPTAISLKNNGGGYRCGRSSLVGRTMTRTDNAAVLFFRAVARDRHPHSCVHGVPYARRL